MIFAIPTDTCYGLACNIYDEKSYQKIYDYKIRDKGKPLSLAVSDFAELESITILTPEQLDFLKNYKFPFTIITKVKPDFVVPEFLDKDMYTEFGFRVASTFLSDEVVKKLNFPIFLTSANLSGEKEIYDSNELRDIFSGLDIEIIDSVIEARNPSNVFRFLSNSLEEEFLRKNY